MGKKFVKVLNILGMTTLKDADVLVLESKEVGIQDEKRWHSSGEAAAAYAIGESIPADFSYLYEALRRLPIQNQTEAKKRLDKALEAFTGGYTTSTLFSEFQDVEELKQMQLAINNKYYSDPHCRSIIDNYTHYTIGGGIKIAVDNTRVFDILTSFRKLNNMAIREKALVKSCFREGELFIPYYVNTKTGITKVRRIRPYEISDIETHPTDIETMFAYHHEYEYSPSGTSQSYKVDKWFRDFRYKHNNEIKKSRKRVSNSLVIQFIKMGNDNEIRGRVPLQPVLRFLKYYEDWLIDRIRLNHERAKVVWIKEVKGRQPETTNRERRSPQGGVMLIETENVKYRIESPKLNADDAKEDGLAILYTIGAGSGLPIHILNQRSGEEVYASIKKSDTPFSQFIRAQQEFFAEHFELMYRFVLEKAVEARKLPKQISVPEYSQEALIKTMTKINMMVLEGKSSKEIVETAKKDLKPKTKMKKVNTVDIPLALEFPEIIKEDPKAQADVMKIHKDIGIVSAATLAARAGYNWQQELVNMINEKALHDQLYPEEVIDPKEPKKKVIKKKEPE